MFSSDLQRCKVNTILSPAQRCKVNIILSPAYPRSIHPLLPFTHNPLPFQCPEAYRVRVQAPWTVRHLHSLIASRKGRLGGGRGKGKASIEEDTCRGDGYEMNTESDRYLIQDLFPRLLGRALAAAGLVRDAYSCSRRMRVRGAQIRASCRWCLAERCVFKETQRNCGCCSVAVQASMCPLAEKAHKTKLI